MNEIAYRKHCERENEARVLYRTIRELYGDEIKKETMFIRARIDRVITQEEKQLLLEFYGR